ncbi:MAG: IS200/IS605 family element RNA-guided endonuclease TnpB [Methanomassiliicoccales archaeon]|jgi:putative transposase
MKVKKSFKYRIYPTKEQEVLLAKHFGAKRFVWNYFLDQRKKAYLENNKTLNYYDNAGSLTKLKKENDYTWIKEVNSQSVQASLRDLEVAYTRFFSKQGNFPRFKSKRDRQSFRIPQSTVYENGKLEIPKFKQPIKVKEDRPISGEILFSTISKSPSGKYYVSITCETEHIPYPKNKNSVGIDLGIKDLAICSDGKIYPNIKNTKRYSKQLSYEQKQLSKKQKGSNSRNRQRIKVAKVHERIGNSRMNHIHKITTQIVRENQTICVEDLSVLNMMKNHKLAKSISDCSWSEFLRQLKYKSEWNERNLITIDKFFPSSKTCNKCKFVNQNLTLEDREWVCPSCGSKLDRDKNASENILEQGLSNFNSGYGIYSESKQKRGEALPIEASLRATKPKHL